MKSVFKGSYEMAVTGSLIVPSTLWLGVPIPTRAQTTGEGEQTE